MGNFAKFTAISAPLIGSTPQDAMDYYAKHNISIPDNPFFQDLKPKADEITTSSDEAAINYNDIFKFSREQLPTIATPTETSTTTSTATPKYRASSKEVKQRGKDVVNFFIKKGLTKEQAAGIAGNLHAESSFNAGAVGDGGTSHGIAQWHNERNTNLRNYSKSKGLDANSINGQLEYLWHELNTTENKALQKLLQTKTPSQAAESFAKNFERMKTYETKRESFANEHYNS